MPGQAAVRDSLIGLEFGHYRILDRVGSGGMGVVYRGYDTHLEREVAIKVLHPGTIADERSRKRFRNEAQALSKLNHPNVATVHDFDTHEGRDFLVMEFIEGVELNKKLLDGSLAEKDVITLGAQLADGLSAAHDHAVIHRDLKPGNLCLTADGRLKILDFGLAKLLRSAKVTPASETLSETHAMAGTLAYMAPEQVLGGEIDVRTDIHAAGTVLYQMATGLPPFTAMNRGELMNEVLRSSPAPASTLNPRLSPELARIIGKCLEREPENRYQSAKELAIDLRRLQSGLQPPTTPEPASTALTSPSSQKKKWMTVIIALVVLLVIGVILHFFPPSVISGRIWPAIPRAKQLTVLPFTAPEGDRETAALGWGLTETLTAKLTQMTRDPLLQVVPAVEVREKHIASVEAAHQEFGANLILQGNLHKSGNQVRINFTLVDPQTRRQLRANTLTIPDGDAFRAEDAVVTAAIEMLGMGASFTPRGDSETYGTQIAGAYDYYLQGRGYLQNYDREENLNSAIQVFQRALALDKNYALAHAGLGEAYWEKYRLSKSVQWLKQSRDSCRAANQINAQLPEAHGCLGNLSLATGDYAGAAKEFSLVLQSEPTNDAAYKGLADSYEGMGKLKEAEGTYKQAIALRPHYWAPYNWLGVFYYRQTRYHEASALFRQVVALAPDSVRGHFNLGASLMDEGLYDESIRASQRSLEIQPSDYGYMNLGSAYFFLRRYEEAIHAYEQSIRYSQNDPLSWWGLGDGYYWAPGRRSESTAAYQKCSALASQQLQTNSKDSDAYGLLAICQAMLGRKNAALAALHHGFQVAPEDRLLMFQAALVYNQFGEIHETLRWLSRCRASGYSLNRIRDYPNFDSLRSDPRFQDLFGPPSSSN